MTALDALFAPAPAPLRILVTASRDWTDRSTMASAISTWLGEQGTTLGRVWPLPILVHGACPARGETLGCDQLAAAIARTWGWTPEPHPADWGGPCATTCPAGHRRQRADGTTWCPQAGPRRNQAMINLGADVCLAFPRPRSQGTWDCVRRAEQAGIPVRIVEAAGAV